MIRTVSDERCLWANRVVLMIGRNNSVRQCDLRWGECQRPSPERNLRLYSHWLVLLSIVDKRILQRVIERLKFHDWHRHRRSGSDNINRCWRGSNPLSSSGELFIGGRSAYTWHRAGYGSRGPRGSDMSLVKRGCNLGLGCLEEQLL